MTEDIEGEAALARCWLDAFPWLDAVTDTGSPGGPGEGGSSTEAPWWLEPVDPPGSHEREARLGVLVDAVLGRLSRWTIGQVFPTLRADVVLADLPLTTRARNVLAREGLHTSADLQGVEIADILGWQNVGVGTISSILRTLADVSTTAAAPVVLVGPARPRGRHRLPVDDDERTNRERQVLRDLQLIAGWHSAIGAADAPLVGEDPGVGTPAEIVAAYRRLAAITARDLFDHDRADLDAAEMLQQSISGLSERAQEVLAKRFFADRPLTLEELGGSMGVTRERVRQLEAAARANVVEFLKPGDTLLEPLTALGLVGEAVREAVGTVLPLDMLIDRFPALARRVKAAGQPAWRVLDRLDDAYEICDGWCVAPTLEAARTLTQARLQEVCNDSGVVRVEDIGALNPGRSQEQEKDFLPAWLERCGYVLDGDYVFTRTRSLGDWAASILTVMGSPLSADEILGRMSIERNLTSLKNALSVDERFTRVDRNLWALVSWGMDSYTGVRALVHQEVARNGGSIALEELIRRITGQYSVSASSVVAYASSPPFRTKSGMVSMNVGDNEARKTPTRTRRLFRRDDSWIYRIKITKDHLRGSGFPAPIAVAGLVGLQYGNTRLLDSPQGRQPVNWTGSQPAFGSIQRFLVASDVGSDTEVFLVLGDDGRFAVESVPPLTGDAISDVLALVGATDGATVEEPRMRLATAIGLPEESPWSSIIGGYRDRGDTDIADLLIAAKGVLEDAPVPQETPRTEIDEILDLL